MQIIHCLFAKKVAVFDSYMVMYLNGWPLDSYAIFFF